MPPQGGEKKLCMSLCAMSLFSVICGVLMVYFTAIIYIPGANVIHSKIQGKIMNMLVTFYSSYHLSKYHLRSLLIGSYTYFHFKVGKSVQHY